MSSAESSLAQLRRAVISQKAASLPQAAEDRALVDLRQQIETYDQCVSQNVIAILQGARETHPCANRQAIEDVLNSLLEEAPAPRRRVLEQFRNYLKRLDAMLELCGQVIAEEQ